MKYQIYRQYVEKKKKHNTDSKIFYHHYSKHFIFLTSSQNKRQYSLGEAQVFIYPYVRLKNFLYQGLNNNLLCLFNSFYFFSYTSSIPVGCTGNHGTIIYIKYKINYIWNCFNINKDVITGKYMYTINKGNCLYLVFNFFFHFCHV